MPTPFPGMDPYLERPGLWEEVHAGLIVAMQQHLSPLLRPRYRVAIERRTYLALLGLTIANRRSRHSRRTMRCGRRGWWGKGGGKAGLIWTLLMLLYNVYSEHNSASKYDEDLA